MLLERALIILQNDEQSHVENRSSFRSSSLHSSADEKMPALFSHFDSACVTSWQKGLFADVSVCLRSDRQVSIALLCVVAVLIVKNIMAWASFSSVELATGDPVHFHRWSFHAFHSPLSVSVSCRSDLFCPQLKA